MLSHDLAPRLIALAMIFVLVGAGLVRRRLPARTLIGLSMVWAAIIGGLWLLLTILPRVR